MRFRRAFAFALVTSVALPLQPAEAATVYEVFWVGSVDGTQIRVEVRRNTAFDPQPVLLTYSPYTVHAGATPANDAYASRYNPRGFARAVAHVIGTGGSDGCWDYGGAKEQQSGVDVVKALAAKPWSNGNVGMIGVSYEGTTATMVAARGDEVPELKAIVPIAAISRWYGYAFHDGARYFLNSDVPTDEGIDTPLVFDAAYARTVSRDRDDPRLVDEAVARAAECGAVSHTYEAYRRDPDYGAFWLERDYRKDASRFRAATLLVHGWQDFNVKQEEAVALWSAIPEDDPGTSTVEGVPLKRMYLTQEPHSDGTGARYLPLLDAFLNRYLKGIANGIESTPKVLTLGRDHAGPATSTSEEAEWPPPGSGMLDLHLGRSFDPIEGVPSFGPIGTTGETGTLSLNAQDDGSGWTHIDPGTISEELTLNDPLNQDGHGYYSLFHQSEPLSRDVRIVGAAQLDAWITTEVPGQHLSPLLVDVQPDGSLRLIERGFLNTDYRNGLASARPASGPMHAVVRFLPQDYTVRAGHRIGLILQGSNTVWAVPGSPGVTSYSMQPGDDVTSGPTILRIPVTDLASARTSPPFP
jgi:X-Pro dipeptidyl-peptidase